MIWRWLADAVVLLHAGFVLFVVVGGFFAWRWPRVAWLHLPAAVWGFLVEWQGWFCPLTPLENWLRERGGEAGYAGGFVEHHLLPLLYPDELTARTQQALALVVLAVNLAAYGAPLWRRWRRRRRGPGSSP